jgi:F-type H+-transporting ATPase subunit a
MSGGHSPLAQFEIKPLISLPEVMGLNIDFTNSSLFMILALAVTVMIFALGTKGRALVPGRWQSFSEMVYEFVAGMVKDTMGSEGKKYFPLVLSVFLFVLICNLLGMIPYSFTVTSHIIVTFAMAMMIFIIMLGIGFARHGIGFFGFFLPPGTPGWIAPLMYIIELFSFLSRPISLSVRLAANMMAGHIMIKIIAGFIVMMLASGTALGYAGAALPFGFLLVITGFEFFIALIQAYIFTLLTCVYLNDVMNHH